MNNLAMLYKRKGQFAEAEVLLIEALESSRRARAAAARGTLGTADPHALSMARPSDAAMTPTATTAAATGSAFP